MPEDINDNVIELPTPQAVAEALAPPSESEEILSNLTPEERHIAAKILPLLAAKANVLAEAMKGKELNALVEQLKADNSKLIEAELKKIQDANKPPSKEDIAKLITQEYIEIPIELREKGGKGQVRTFIIRELTQFTEMKLMRIIQKAIVPRLKEFSTIEWTASMSQVEKIQKVVDTIPEALDLLADCAAIALDPYEEEGITKEWVQKHLSSNRIMGVIDAQVMAGRFRDFAVAVAKLLPQ